MVEQRATVEPGTQPESPGSDAARARLELMASAYLDAIAAHDPARVTLAPSFRATENGAVMRPGQGVWTTVTRFRSRQFFIDTISNQVLVIGAVDCGGDLFPYAFRIAIAGDAIAEAEMMVSPSARGHFADVDQLLKPDVLYDAPVPAARGCGTRERLQAIANLYWDALNESDGSLAPFNHRCDRYGNGKKITNSLYLLLSPDAAVHTPASLITATRPARPKVIERRFPVLDVARGVAGSIAVVEFGKNADRPDAGAFYIFGVVKIVDDEIRNVDHLNTILPAGTRSGW